MVCGVASVTWTLAAAFMVLFRERVYERFRGAGTEFAENLDGQVLVLTEDLAPGASCRMEFRGSTWTVMNRGSRQINSGESATVARVESTTLVVRETAGQT